jgi:hypothetical protein
MDIIGYQIWDTTEGNMGGSNKEARRETKESAGSTGSTPVDVGSSQHHEREEDWGRTIHGAKERTRKHAQTTLTQLTIGHRTLQIEADALEFPMGELQEKINALGHLNIVVSKMPMQRLQDLQAGLLQEMKNRGEEAHRELERIRDERAQL